jgi:hypothetical protein
LNPPDLIKTARDLVAANKGKPRQASLHRATSTAYYALFHTLAKCCADMLVGTAGSERSKPAWHQTYRAVNHAKVKERCNATTTMAKFPQGIRNFGNMLLAMQIKRHDADYNPDAKSFKSAVLADIDAVEAVIKAFHAVGAKDRRAFAVWVLVDIRRS